MRRLRFAPPGLHDLTALDLATLAYLGVCAALCVLSRPPGAPWLFAAHVVAMTGVLTMGRLARTDAAGVARFLPFWIRDGYPLLLLPWLYVELPRLNAPFLSVARDEAVRRLETLVFPRPLPGSVVHLLSAVPVSEALHVAYLTYYPLIYALPLALALRPRPRAFYSTVFAIMATYYSCYVLYLVMPVRGPWDLGLATAAHAGAVDGPVRRLVIGILRAGSSTGAAFPSSHEAVAVAEAVCALRFLPRLAPAIAALSAGIGLGAVAGSLHYGIDILAGAAVGLAAAALVTSGTRHTPM